MISDEPDDDDDLDDEAALDSYLGTNDLPKRDRVSVELPDWPAPTKRDAGLDLDVDTLAWFKQNHADWRREIRFVLRAWVVAKATQPRAALALGHTIPAVERDGPHNRP
jgi:hypothetical protein